MTLGGIFRPGMRGYFVPLGAGLALLLSAFLPWVVVGNVSRRGVPDMPALWTAGLGAVAAVLALLSLITRRNSRHPLLVVGLAALAIVFLSWRIMPRLASERAWTAAQARAILSDTPAGAPPVAVAGSGIYLGILASFVIVCFGMTIVVRRASSAYVVVNPDDDVE
jgi:hypothetical protein